MLVVRKYIPALMPFTCLSAAARLAALVGRENMIASTDCGFAQTPFHQRTHETIQWAKLEALVEGAEIASKELWV